MGQDIHSTRFKTRDFNKFIKRLRQETQLLADWVRKGKLSIRGPIGGFELEAWLTDRTFAPACANLHFIQSMKNPLVAAELAQFNVEFNNQPRPLMGRALGEMQRELETTWARGVEVAASCEMHLLSIGILPTLEAGHLRTEYLTPLNRYYALNEQVLRRRGGRPLRLNVCGRRHLRCEHGSMVLEAAGTSFQIHLQAPLERIHRLYNAALAVSAPVLAAGANSPYLLGVDLWDESRMPLFEQSLDVGGYGGASQGPLRRVGLGLGYVRDSIMECFEENLQHFPVLLPVLIDDEPERFSHLRLHNGTVWRWNRPLIGFDEDGTPHVRIEHRVLPGSPTITDAVSDAALFYGLVEYLCAHVSDVTMRLPFARVKENFHRAARHGLAARITWLDGAKTDIRALLLDDLLPSARRGLLAIGIDTGDCDRYLGIVKQRVERCQNGARWQRAFVERHGHDMRALTAAYADHQRSGAPVHTWEI